MLEKTEMCSLIVGSHLLFVEERILLCCINPHGKNIVGRGTVERVSDSEGKANAGRMMWSAKGGRDVSSGEWGEKEVKVDAMATMQEGGNSGRSGVVGNTEGWEIRKEGHMGNGK